MTFKAYNSFLIWPPNDKIDDCIFQKVVKSTSRWQMKKKKKKNQQTHKQTSQIEQELVKTKQME